MARIIQEIWTRPEVNRLMNQAALIGFLAGIATTLLAVYVSRGYR